MDKPGEKYIPQHKRIAMGDPDPFETGNFGCGSAFESVGGESTPRGTMKEGSRAITRPRGFHPEPDHGEY
jgi:hypothetical protein